MTMQAVFLTTPELQAEHWATVAELVAPAVTDAARGEFTLEDLGAMVRDGRAVAGLATHDGAPVMGMVFEFRHYPRRQVINVMALGGSNLADITTSFWQQFTGWARESGVAEIEACASPAMSRILKQIGFAHTYNVMRIPC